MPSLFSTDASQVALTQLTRLAQRRPDTAGMLEKALAGRLQGVSQDALWVAVETGDPIGRVLAWQLEAHATPDLLETIVGQCDRLRFRSSVPLREVALVATRKVLDACRAAGTAPTEARRARLATLANNVSGRLKDLGRREEAVAAIEEAVAVCRELSRRRPEEFLPDLAMSLHNRSGRLSDVGRREEALAAIEDAG